MAKADVLWPLGDNDLMILAMQAQGSSRSSLGTRDKKPVPVRRSIVVLMTASSPWSQAVARYLSGQGLSVHVADFSPQGYLTANRELASASIAALRNNVAALHYVPTPRSLSRRILSIVGAARTLRRIVRRSNASLVLTLYGGANAAIACLSGVRPYIVYVVGSDVLLRANGIRRLLSRVWLTGASTVLANGKYLASRTVDVAPRARVRPLYLGIDLKRYRSEPRRDLAPRFVCTRGFGRVYDNATIVRAVAALRRIPSNFELRFVSTGPLLTETIALADRLLPFESRSKVVFDGGASDDGVTAALRRASIYLSASLSDGTSTSLLEAMACRLFPIVSDIPANREWISDGENGLVFPPNDHVSLARCMERVMAGEVSAAALETNYRLVADRANVDVSMAQLLEMLETHVDGHRPAAQAK
jgi:glycosyltransferase involved in cell wall biosynthesis